MFISLANGTKVLKSKNSLQIPHGYFLKGISGDASTLLDLQVFFIPRGILTAFLLEGQYQVQV